MGRLGSDAVRVGDGDDDGERDVQGPEDSVFGEFLRKGSFAAVGASLFTALHSSFHFFVILQFLDKQNNSFYISTLLISRFQNLLPFHQHHHISSTPTMKPFRQQIMVVDASINADMDVFHAIAEAMWRRHHNQKTLQRAKRRVGRAFQTLNKWKAKLHIQSKKYMIGTKRKCDTSAEYSCTSLITCSGLYDTLDREDNVFLDIMKGIRARHWTAMTVLHLGDDVEEENIEVNHQNSKSFYRTMWKSLKKALCCCVGSTQEEDGIPHTQQSL